jgi:hypothetical protein
MGLPAKAEFTWKWQRKHISWRKSEKIPFFSLPTGHKCLIEKKKFNLFQALLLMNFFFTHKFSNYFRGLSLRVGYAESGSRARVTWQVGSGSGPNHSGSTTLHTTTTFHPFHFLTVYTSIYKRSIKKT